MAACHRAQVYKIDPVSGQRVIYTGFSYCEGETFGDIRARFSAILGYPFQFLDAVNDSPIPVPFEGALTIANNKSEIIIKQTTAPPRMQTPQSAPLTGPATGPSSNASNTPTVTQALRQSHDQEQPVLDDQASDQSADTETETADKQEPSLSPYVELVGTRVETQILLESILMPKHFRKLWASQAKSLEVFMKPDSRKHNRWRVQTWDANELWKGHIFCVECDKPYSGAGTDEVMDKTSINSCFTNYKNKHLKVKKHMAALARRLGSSAVDVGQRNRDAAEVVAAAIAADKELLTRHQDIVNDINQVEDRSKDTFTIEGNQKMEPLDFAKLKLLCTICLLPMAFVSKQCNLRSNLETHLVSKARVEAKARRQRPSSGQAVLTGTSGRPRVVDSRDIKQPSIAGFFSAGAKAASRRGECSSATNEGRGIVDNLSLLCWGLWFESIKYGGVNRPIKGVLDDQIREDGAWYGEPELKAEVWCLTSQTTEHIAGAFRHRQCTRVSQGGGGFKDLTCQYCWGIKGEPDFRGRVLREYSATEKRGGRDTGKGCRLGYLTQREGAHQAGQYRRVVLRERRNQRVLRHQLLMARRKVPRIAEICQESANRKDILKFCNSIVLAHKTGAFGGKPALWDMLKDIASNVNSKKEGYRYSEASRMLSQTLLLHGGRRVIHCLSENGIGPSLNTLQRDCKGMSVFQTGIRPETFKFLGDAYVSLKEKLGIVGPVPCFLAEDETTVKKTVTWLPKSDTLLGFCGSVENHKCMVGLEIPVGDGEVGLNNITAAFQDNVMGYQARCMIVNPMHEDLPRLCALATITCNKFDAAWVRDQWVAVKALWDIHCLQKVGPLLGHASDGDSRRRKLMLEDYTGKGKSGPRFHVGWDGWPLSHAIVRVGDQVHAYGLHDQDYIHNGKKLMNALDSISRRLHLGSQVATFSHLKLVEMHYDMLETSLTKVDTDRTDRQNWASAQRLCSRKVIAHLEKLAAKEDAGVEHTLGTVIYLSICADYLDIFMNTSLTLRQRIVLCGKVGFFFRLWRLWFYHGNHYVGNYKQTVKFDKCCIPMQSFLDIQMSVHFVVFLIIQFRENYMHLSLPLSRTGSDPCEQFFSKIGNMNGHERAYGMVQLVDCATSLNRLAELGTSGKVHIGKNHKKHRDIWMSRQLEQLPTAEQKDCTGIETNADVVQALKEGFVLAQSAAKACEMAPPKDELENANPRDIEWFMTPWIIEKRGVKAGGWCEINTDGLAECSDVIDIEPEVAEPVVVGQIGTSNVERCEADLTNDGVNDLDIAEAGVQEVMAALASEVENGGSRHGASTDTPHVKNTVTWKGQEMYKSTVVAGYVGNPQLSKDRLTRVKETFYVNSQVDKAKNREGLPTMIMQVGTDCGVLFEDEKQECTRESRSKDVAKALQRKRTGKNQRGKLAVNKSTVTKYNKPKGQAVAVESSVAVGKKHVLWLGRVQTIIRKAGRTWYRCRIGVDLLDRPEDGSCKVSFNWFSSANSGRRKFKYDVCDPDWIDLDSVIQTVKLIVDPSQPKVFQLDADDARKLDDFVKNKAQT